MRSYHIRCLVPIQSIVVQTLLNSNDYILCVRERSILLHLQYSLHIALWIVILALSVNLFYGREEQVNYRYTSLNLLITMCPKFLHFQIFIFVTENLMMKEMFDVRRSLLSHRRLSIEQEVYCSESTRCSSYPLLGFGAGRRVHDLYIRDITNNPLLEK